MRSASGFAAVVMMVCLFSSTGTGSQLRSTVQSEFGIRPTRAQGGVKIRVPRTDLTVRIGDVTVAPGLALTSWAAFWEREHFTEVRGDLVLQAGEVHPVTKTLTQDGIDVTALHNHMLAESPRLFYLHFWARGPGETLAQGIRSALNHASIERSFPRAKSSGRETRPESGPPGESTRRH